MPMFMTHIKYETGSLQALFNGQQFVWVFYDAVGPWRPKNRTSLAPKAHTCSSPDDDGGDVQVRFLGLFLSISIGLNKKMN